MQICANCKWGVLKYSREYKGVIIGCQNPNEKTRDNFLGEHCYIPKEKESADNTGED